MEVQAASGYVGEELPNRLVWVISEELSQLKGRRKSERV